MRFSSINEVDEGEVLGRSIYQPNGKLLLGAGFRINQGMRAKLLERGYTHIYIMEEGTEDVIPEDVISEEIRLQAREKLNDKITEIKSQTIFADLAPEKAIDLLERGYLRKVNITYDMRLIVQEILKDISAASTRFLNTVMIKSADTYFIDHAINTTVIALLIGRKFRFSKPELLTLGLGTFLHDIGKVVIEQLKGADDPAKARSLYCEHPTFGYLLIRDSKDVTPMEAQIVNQHHEYQDGSGFPIGLRGQNLPPTKPATREIRGQIYRLAEICCVANAFENLAYDPVKKQPLDLDGAIKTIVLDSEKKYNSDVVQALLRVVPIYPVGVGVRVVEILDASLIGYYGVVAKISERHLNKPVIILTRNKFNKKIKPIVIDTSKLSSLELQLDV
jgi:HD-GYP domain-containing protein (c-di-GMP phosphodiesterase class II)